MKKLLYIVIPILVLLLVFGLILLYTNSQKTKPINSQATEFPLSTNNQPAIQTSSGTTHIVGIDGTNVNVKDFLNNGETVQNSNDPSSYQLAGSLGYCLANGTCPSGAHTTNFSIAYDTKNGIFNVLLLEEPLSSSRTSAESFLEKRLGLSKTELCNLNYSVGTINSVNDTYAGQELGFSTCPNAVVLP